MSEVSSILVVDDEAGIRNILDQYLSEQGFQVVTAEDAVVARKIIEEQEIDLVILDITMPGEDGLSLARYLKQQFAIRVIMLTALGEVIDRVVGLEVGADDYMSKPFDPRELLARIRSLSRRMPTTAAQGSEQRPVVDQQLVRVGHCNLDLDTQRLITKEGEELQLTRMEFDLLQVFLQHPNRVLNRDQLFNYAHDRDWEPFDRSIDVRVTRLRRKLEIDPRKPEIIKTVHGKGYMYVPTDSA